MTSTSGQPEGKRIDWAAIDAILDRYSSKMTPEKRRYFREEAAWSGEFDIPAAGGNRLE